MTRADKALAAVQRCPVVPLGNWPTPVTEGRSTAGDVLIKRDDLSGFGRGGAKTRKIEGLVGFLKERGHDELITFAGNVTNVAFDITPVLREHDITNTLLVVDDPHMSTEARLDHFYGILSDVRLLNGSYVTAARAAATAFVSGKQAGRRPLVVLPGVSHPSAILGNTRGMLELAEQHLAGGPWPKTIFVSVATGNTIAGFLIGAALLQAQGLPPIDIVGVQVTPGRIDLLAKFMTRWTLRWLGAAGLPVPKLRILTTEVGAGFGDYPERLVHLCDRVRDHNDISIDPVFGGKTWSAMEAVRSAGLVTGPCLFWHCGYTPEWRDLRVRSSKKGVTHG